MPLEPQPADSGIPQVHVNPLGAWTSVLHCMQMHFGDWQTTSALPELDPFHDLLKHLTVLRRTVEPLPSNEANRTGTKLPLHDDLDGFKNVLGPAIDGVTQYIGFRDLVRDNAPDRPLPDWYGELAKSDVRLRKELCQALRHLWEFLLRHSGE
jgi:hypothetical protein